MAFYKNKVIARNSFGFGLRLCVVVVDVSLKDGAVTVYTNKGVCFSKKELKRLFKKNRFTYHGTIVQPKICQKRS